MEATEATEATDFYKHKNLQKSNKPFYQRKYKDIKRPKYKCPATRDNCYECSRHHSKTNPKRKERHPKQFQREGVSL